MCVRNEWKRRRVGGEVELQGRREHKQHNSSQNQTKSTIHIHKTFKMKRMRECNIRMEGILHCRTHTTLDEKLA